MNGPFPETAEMLREVGIDPATVAVHDFCADHYNVFIIDANGKRVIYGDRPSIAFREFPTPEIGQAIFNVYQAEKHDQLIGTEPTA